MDDNNMIHAVSDGPKTGVIISSLQDRYFAPRIIGVRSFFLAEEYPIENQPERSEPVISDNPAETEIPTESWLPTESGLPTESLGFTITNESVTYIDKIPAVTGSGIRFAITNGTEQNGTFEILFYKMDPVFSNIKTLYQTRVHIDEGKMIETDPFIFTEPGQYKLILKTGSNLKRVERIWQVVEQ
jgi:hypothetical protein